ncbi:hypothetical protein GpartN1_g5368.t1 [Galdieria partita]|uniref:Phosphoinositide 5-phosphatase n=1 Tax=Galdieria partita TaxID=83374 RepID=A0A9C7Q144_9RHOD|nr:hypothetical protein GpartN1_g5368.t1 [Galdieria partita]
MDSFPNYKPLNSPFKNYGVGNQSAHFSHSDNDSPSSSSTNNSQSPFVYSATRRRASSTDTSVGSQPILAKDLEDIENEQENILNSSKARRAWIRREVARRAPEYTESFTVTIFVTTWNVNGRKPIIEIRDWLLPSKLEMIDEDNQPFIGSINVGDVDIYVIGLQEVQELSGTNAVLTDPNRGRLWQHRIEMTLFAPERYVCVQSRQLVGILLLVFVRKDHEMFTRDVMVTEVGTGIMNRGGNKGGVVTRMRIYDTTLCIASCHLTAHDHNVERRNQDFHELMRKAIFMDPDVRTSPYSPYAPDPNMAHESNFTTVADHDFVFFLGDLNYRINLPVEEVMSCIHQADWKHLREYDQLNLARKAKAVFQGFEEGVLNFAPTYKHEPFGDGYEEREEGGLKRTPAWCDRVLWKAKQSSNIRQLAYQRHELYSSDHRPVLALFEAKFRRTNKNKKNQVIAEVQRMLEQRENELRPQIALSCQDISLGLVEFNIPATSTLTVTNVGRVKAKISFPPRRFPSWLRVAPPACELEPQASIELHFRILVDVDCGSSSSLSFGDEELSCTLVLHVEFGNDYFISIYGQYKKTCFGSNLERLAHPHLPFRASLDSSSIKAAFRPRIPTTKGLPCEIWRLGHVLWQRRFFAGSWDSIEGSPTFLKDLERSGRYYGEGFPFIESGDPEQALQVRECLDTGQPIPNYISGKSIAFCLCQFLRYLEDPVIPREFCSACVTAAKSASLDTVKQVVSLLPPVHQNVLIYLVELLKEFLHCYSSHRDYLFTCIPEIFSDLLLCSSMSNQDSAALEAKERANFIRMLLVDSEPAQVIFDIHVSS